MCAGRGQRDDDDSKGTEEPDNRQAERESKKMVYRAGGYCHSVQFLRQDCSWKKCAFAFMNLCDYFICPEGEEEGLGTLAAKTMNMKLLAEDCTTEMPYSFQAMSWNEEQSGKLDELIEGKRTSDE